MIPVLAPLFQDEWAPYGEGMTCPPHPAPPVDGARHLLPVLMGEPATLRTVLVRHARHLGVAGEDLRATAAAWSLDYLWLLLPATIAGACVLRHGLPLDPASCLLDLDAHGAPTRLHLPHEGQALRGDLDSQAHRETLVRSHLSPLFAALRAASGLPLKILWGNAARVLADIFAALSDVARASGDGDGNEEAERHVTHQGSAWLTACAWPDGEPNPLWLHGGKPPTLLAITSPSSCHAQCCLRHLLPGLAHCGRCPLTPSASRAALASRQSQSA